MCNVNNARNEYCARHAAGARNSRDTDSRASTHESMRAHPTARAPSRAPFCALIHPRNPRRARPRYGLVGLIEGYP